MYKRCSEICYTQLSQKTSYSTHLWVHSNFVMEIFLHVSFSARHEVTIFS